MNSTKYTVLIQGPLDRTSLDFLELYKNIGKVVISYWDSCDDSILSGYDLQNVSLVKRSHPENSAYGNTLGLHYPTLRYQLTSIRNGLGEISTEYTIRTRSDERYTLNKMIEHFERNTDKILCGNILFRNWGMPFHVGDHLFIGKTEIIYSAYKRLLQQETEYEGVATAEQLLAFALLDAASLPRTKEAFVELFDIIDINTLAPFIAQMKFLKFTFIDFYGDTSVIRSMDEL